MGRRARGRPLDGALLVRLRLGEPAELASLPAVPAPRTCTVTVNLVDVDTLPLADLAERGYRVSGFANARADDGPCADVLVPAPLATNEAWFGRLAALADRVFAIDLGPVQRVFAAELAVHEAMAATAPTSA